MSWRKLVEEEICRTWPTEQRRRCMEAVAPDNDHAERLGFTCHLDDRLGFGRCYFTLGHVRVWESPEGWRRATCVGVAGVYGDHTLFRTQNQALRDESAFARINRFGQHIPTPKE